MDDPHTSKLYDVISRGRRIVLKKGQVFQNSDTNLQMSVIKSGYIKRYIIRNDGSLGVQSIYGPGYFFPLTVAYKLLLEQDTYSGPEAVHYEAMTNAVIYSLDNETFKTEVSKDMSLYRSLFYVSGWRTHSNIQRLENMSLLVYYNRVAHQLLYFIELFGKKQGNGVIIDVPLTQQDLADILSSTRETVSLCIVELKKKRIIKSAHGKKILVLDIVKLKREAYA